MILDFSINQKKKKHNIKNKKLNCSLHTKKSNNINKLMQISYHSTLTKIQNLQKKKKKKRTFFLYWLVRPIPAGNAQNRLV